MDIANLRAARGSIYRGDQARVEIRGDTIHQCDVYLEDVKLNALIKIGAELLASS